MSLSSVLSCGLSGGLSGLSRGGRVRGAWSPADLTGLVADLLIAEARNTGRLWQDTAKTVPAVADGDPVRVAQGRYVSVEWAAPSDAARPLLYEEGGGKWSLDFDGIDDEMVAASLAGTSFGTATLHARWTFASLTNYMLAFKGTGNGAASTDIEWRHFGGMYQFKRDGAPVGSDPLIAVATGTHTYALAFSGATADGYRDGVLGTANNTIPGNATGTAHPLRIGRRTDGFGPVAGRTAGQLFYTSRQSSGDVAVVAAYLGAL